MIGGSTETIQAYQPTTFAASIQANPEPVVVTEPVDPATLNLGFDAHTMLNAQTGKQSYEDDKSCGDKGCNSNGICFSSVCYCNKYHSGEKCEQDMAHPGVKAPITFVFYAVALLLGIVTGGFVAKIYNENDKKLFL